MGVLDPNNNAGLLNGGDGSFDYSRLIPLLSLAAGAGAASAPSRLPVTNGMVISSAADGFLKGVQAQQQYQAAKNQLALSNLTLQGYQRLQAMNGGGPPR